MDFGSANWLRKNSRKRPRLNVQSGQDGRSMDYQFDDDANQPDELFSKLSGLNEKLPIDWSLKTRVRFSSKRPFPWAGQFRAFEDALGITSFVRCQSNTYENPPGSEKVQNTKSENHNRKEELMAPADFDKKAYEQIDSSQTATLRKHSLVWMYPHLPWLKLFPRIESSSTLLGSSQSNSQPDNGKMDPLFKDAKSPYCEQLKVDWCVSLRSLFHLVKARHCPFFYMCGSSFTALFRAAGVAGVDNMHALISNSTPGLRKMLKEEGVEFIMPFMETEEAEETKKEVEFEGNILLEEDSQIFLESLGLSQQDFPSMTSSRKIAEPAEEKKKSMLYIKGKNTNLLLTFFCNTSLVIPSTGKFTGIPPTLLSPVAFTGSSLHSLKLKVTETFQNGQPLHYLDLMGPIMPSLVQSITTFLRNTQGEYKAQMNIYENTSPFALFSSTSLNKRQNLMSLFATENLKDCGLNRNQVADFCRQSSQAKVAVNEVIVDSTGFRIK